MGELINLMNVKPKYYDGPPRNLDTTFGYDYFDGSRERGCGGYTYMPGYWKPGIENILNRYKLPSTSKVLDIGCAKGFFLAELLSMCPQMEVQGIDISEYAIANAHESVKPFVSLGSADNLNRYADHSFDLVLGVNCLHFLAPERVIVALKEIVRVGKKNYFVQVDSFHNEVELERMLAWAAYRISIPDSYKDAAVRLQLPLWAPIIKTIYTPEQWIETFNKAGYDGDCYWTLARPTRMADVALDCH